MSVPFAVCDRTTGEIIRAGLCPRRSFEAQETNENERVFRFTEDASLFRVEADSTDDDNVRFQLLLDFPGDLDKTSIVSDGVDQATLYGLPTPCTVYVDGVPQVVEDGHVRFKTSTPGAFDIEVRELEYKNMHWRIIADD